MAKEKWETIYFGNYSSRARMCSLSSLVGSVFHFISFHFHFILLRRVALQPELFYKGPST